jgi:hypothetical protein
MTVRINKPALNLREELTKAQGVVRYEQRQFWFEADGVETVFTIPVGFEPLHVYDAGLLQKEGDTDDYTVSGNVVTFSVAPTNLNRVAVIGVRA